MNSGLLKKFLTLLILICSAPLLHAATYYVDGNSGNDANSGSSSAPWGTLTYAVTQVASGDIIMISGTLTEVNVSIDKALTIQGEDPSTSILQAQVNQPDGNGTNAAPNKRILAVTETGTLALNNITLQHGNITGGVGGAIVVLAGGTLNIENCNIQYCYTDGGGGAIGGWGDATINNCSIAFNTAVGNGGALAFYDSNVDIENTVIFNNFCGSKGGAVSIAGQSTTAVFSMNGNTIVDNKTNSDARKGIYTNGLVSCTALTNNLLFNAASGGVDFGYDGSVNPVASATVTNNIVSKCWLTELRDEPNSLTWETTPAVNATNLNLDTYKTNGKGLFSIALLSGSIAIDAGDAATATSTDINGAFRDANPDIGAFEYGVSTDIASPTFKPYISPNPSHGTFTIEFRKSGANSVEIFALNGQKILSKSIYSSQTEVTIPEKVKGLIFIVVHGNGVSKVYKHIVLE